MFIESARKNATRTAYVQREGDAWAHMTYTEALARAERIGAGLLALGVKAGDRV
ncbi:MAG: AMP-binding protein, partial [Thermoleophilia bacterium]|nr:AMP-binding protein [Thermoleophilia bacterium]